MAKSRKAKRIFEVARELGVTSKVVLEKCRAEGIEMDNHMSSVSLGLEATICEWFTSEEELDAHTAVETAAKVEATQAKAKPRKKAAIKKSAAKKKTDTAEESEADEQKESDAATAKKKAKARKKKKVEPKVEDTTEETAVKKKTKKKKSKTQFEAEPEKETEAQTPDQPTEETQPAQESQTPDEPAQEDSTTEDDSVKPGGPLLETPKAAKLKGPKVVRIEAPEQTRQPRQRRGGPNDSGIMRSRGPQGGSGAMTPGAPPAESGGGRSPRRRKGGKGRESDDRPARLSDSGNRTRNKGAWRQQDIYEREQMLRGSRGFMDRRRRQQRQRQGVKPAETPATVGGKVEIEEPISIKGLSAATGIKGAEIVQFLFNKGIMANINAAIDTELAMEICMEYDIELEVKEARTAEDVIAKDIEEREAVDVDRRPPVVTILGHVDHGKTSLLDRIRSQDVASGEDGGITQHIGAYRATITGHEGEEKTVVFLDTPGHEAFTSMRARGANMTDIVVIVVAADDGVMPQTIESIDHAKAAEVPIVVALNKIDTPQATDANITRILGQLAEHGLNPVEWGGDTEVLRTSAETGEGITELIEMLDYQAELLNLKADYGGTAHGQVIEAEQQPGRGAVARILVQEGTLRIGDFIVIGRGFGRVRDMIDDRGRQVEVAGPATPLEISGIDEIPDAGDKFYVTQTLKKAEQIAEQRRETERKYELATRTKVTLDNFMEQIGSAEVKILPVVIKADVQGSVEVLRKAVEEQSNDEVQVRVVRTAVGGITESDVLLAEASNAIILGFHVIPSQKARHEAEARRVEVRQYRVIYDMVDDIRAALEGLLSPEHREEVLGHAEVREVFRVSKVGSVAGCYVTDGVIQRSANIRVTRDDVIIEYDRTLEQLKRFKDDAKEVRSGMECGMKIEGYDDIREGDVLECYITHEEAAKLMPSTKD